MKYIPRKIEKDLFKWKNDDNRLALLIFGPRQVGKTTTILNFAKNNFKNYVYINFIEEPKFKEIINEGFSSTSIIKEITRLDPKLNITPETLIIFDEVQELPDITTSFKFLLLEGYKNIIATGSMLSLQYTRITSLSVGFINILKMYPLSFEEYLYSLGVRQEYIDDVYQKMITLSPLTQTQFTFLSDAFKEFMLLGGYPQIVERFLTQKQYSSLYEMQRILLEVYREDLIKFSYGLDSERLKATFDSLPYQLAKENKKFQLSKINHNARLRDYQGTITRLLDLSYAVSCFQVKSFNLPLSGNIIDNSFKLYYQDLTFLLASLEESVYLDYRVNFNYGVYNGAIYENIVASELIKTNNKLFYFRNQDGTLQLDFLLSFKDKIIPLEVKSNRGKAKSLEKVLKENKECLYGIKLSFNNIGKKDNIITFPYFLTFLVPQFIKDYSNSIYK